MYSTNLQSRNPHHSSLTNVRVIPPTNIDTEISDLISMLIPFSKSRYHSENPQLNLSEEICEQFKISILENNHNDF